MKNRVCAVGVGGGLCLRITNKFSGLMTHCICTSRKEINGINSMRITTTKKCWINKFSLNSFAGDTTTTTSEYIVVACVLWCVCVLCINNFCSNAIMMESNRIRNKSQRIRGIGIITFSTQRDSERDRERECAILCLCFDLNFSVCFWFGYYLAAWGNNAHIITSAQSFRWTKSHLRLSLGRWFGKSCVWLRFGDDKIYIFCFDKCDSVRSSLLISWRENEKLAQQSLRCATPQPVLHFVV